MIGSRFLNDGSVGAAPDRALAQALESVLGLPGLSMHVLATSTNRAVIQLRDVAGEIRAYAKVAGVGESNLAQEAMILTALGKQSSAAIVAPRLLAHLVWNDFDVVVIGLVPTSGRADRQIGELELAGILEIQRLLNGVAVAEGSRAGQIHGDFTAWNTAPTADGRLAVWDWEGVRPGPPLDDYLQWRAMQTALLGTDSVERIAGDLRSPSSAALIQFLSEAVASPGTVVDTALQFCERRIDPRGIAVPSRVAKTLEALGRELVR